MDPESLQLGPATIIVRRAAVGEIIPLRHRILRAGLPIEEAHFPGDTDPSTIHVAAFDGVTAVQQRNAIQSWQQLGDWVEVVLVGDDPGTAETARNLHVRHMPNVERNAYGTPLVDSVFRLGIGRHALEHVTILRPAGHAHVHFHDLLAGLSVRELNDFIAELRPGIADLALLLSRK